MDGSAKEFFETLPDRAQRSTVRGLSTRATSSSIDGAGTWTVVGRGRPRHRAEGDSGGDCTFSASEKTFLSIVDGQQNPLTAYMTGKLKVKGDIGAAMKLKHLLG